MLSFSHDRQADRLPADARLASFGKVLPCHIPSSVQIGVSLIPTLNTSEYRLSRSIPFVNMTALCAPLASMARINRNHLTTRLFRLVGQECSKLCVAPRVMSAPLFPPTLLSTATNVGEVFNDDHATRLHTPNN